MPPAYNMGVAYPGICVVALECACAGRVILGIQRIEVRVDVKGFDVIVDVIPTFKFYQWVVMHATRSPWGLHLKVFTLP
jgi:hypothetical protein